MTDTDCWLIREEVAGMVRLSPKTLANWAAMNPPKGPRFAKVGGKVRYRRSDVEAWQNGLLAADAA